MARVDYDRMAPDYLEGRALPPAGMAPWRDEIARLAAGGPGRAVAGARPGRRDRAVRGRDRRLVRGRGHRRRAVPGDAGPGGPGELPPGRPLGRGVGERLPLRNGTGAMPWVSTVVHHLDDAAVAELGRVLRPGAPMLVRQAFSRPHQVAVGGWPDQGLGLVGEADQAHTQVGRDLVEQV